ncbi:hypothetical protein AVEN_41223-1, partial [Araneus ventricosus]
KTNREREKASLGWEGDKKQHQTVGRGPNLSCSQNSRVIAKPRLQPEQPSHRQTWAAARTVESSPNLGCSQDSRVIAKPGLQPEQPSHRQAQWEETLVFAFRCVAQLMRSERIFILSRAGR